MSQVASSQSSDARSINEEVRLDLQSAGLGGADAVMSSVLAVHPAELGDRALAVLSPKVLRAVDGKVFAQECDRQLAALGREIDERRTQVEAQLPSVSASSSPGLFRAAVSVLRGRPTNGKRTDSFVDSLLSMEERATVERLSRQLRVLALCGQVVAQVRTSLQGLDAQRDSFRQRARDAAVLAQENARLSIERLSASEGDLPSGTLPRLVDLLAAEDTTVSAERGVRAVARVTTAPVESSLDAPVAIVQAAREDVERDLRIVGSVQDLIGRVALSLGRRQEDGRRLMAQRLHASLRSSLPVRHPGEHLLVQVVPAGARPVLKRDNALLPATSFSSERPDRLGLLQLVGDVAFEELASFGGPAVHAERVRAARIVRSGDKSPASPPSGSLPEPLGAPVVIGPDATAVNGDGSVPNMPVKGHS